MNTFYYYRSVIFLTLAYLGISLNTPLQATLTQTHDERPLFEEVSKKVRSKKRPTCLLYGNCQVGFIYQYLRKNYPRDYDYVYIANYLVLEGQILFPFDTAEKADLFIYQPLHGHGINDTGNIQSHHLKMACKQVSLPYIYFLGYFPDFAQDPNNLRTFTPSTPFGIFPYGSKKLMSLIAEGYSIDQIIQKSFADDFITPEVIFEKYFSSLERLRGKELETDIKLADFIQKKFRKYNLFLSTSHPTNYLLKELMKQVLTKLNRSTKNVDDNRLFKKEFFANWTNGIIYPCVAKTLGLKFDISTLCFKGKMVPYPVYITEYVQCLYPDHQPTR